MARSDFSKHLVTLISGTTVAQLISIGISPVLSRMYSEEEFGLFGAYSSITGLMCLLVGVRYEGAILLPKKNSDAFNLLVLAIFLNFTISLLFLTVIFGLSFFVTNSELFNWFYLAPIFTFFTGVAQSVNNWLNRKKKYGKIVYYRVTNAAANNGLSLMLGFVKISSNGLIISYFTSAIASVAVFYSELKSDYLEFRSSVSKSKMLELAKEYKRFPLTNSVQSLSDALQINGVIYFVTSFFWSFLGVFSFAMRVLLVPMNFAGAAMAQVFYQHASETYNQKGDLRALIRTTFFKSVVLTIPVLIVLLLFGPQLFAFVFGEKWYDSGVYAQILAPWLLLDFVRAPLSQVPIIVGKQNRLLTISLVSNLIVLVTMLYAGFILKDLKSGLMMLSIIQSVFIIGVIAWIYKIASNQR